MIPIYVLYCEELAERQAACREHLHERGVEAKFWRGFHGFTWGLDTTKEFDPGKRIAPGHVGLNLGAWAMWQHIYESTRGLDDDRAIVTLEDDALVPHHLGLVVSDLEIELNYHQPDWDLVFLGLAQTEPHVWHNVYERIGPPNSRLCRLSDPFGTHALMIRRRALPVLMRHMTVAQRNLDQQLYERVLKPGHLNWCAVLPSLVTQRTFDYKGSGRPEWTASTIPAAEMTASEIKEVLGHRDEERAGPSAETYAASMALIDPLPCIYRGEALLSTAKTVTGKTVPMFDCGRFAGPCYSRPGVKATEPPEVLSCEACTVRTQMTPDSPRGRLPVPDGHFNPSIHWWMGKLILATRDSWGHSKVALWELTNTVPDWSGEWKVKPIGSYGSPHPRAPRLEDPRLFVSNDPNGRPSLCCMFNLPDGYPPKRVEVGYVRFAADLSGIIDTVVFPSVHNNAYEKNWVPFADEDGIHWVYSIKPTHLVLGDGCSNWGTDNKLPWTGGVCRGGAAPVLVRGYREAHIQDMPDAVNAGFPMGKDYPFSKHSVYYHFFHGCLKRVQGSVYTVGCCVFEARPPYKILRQTASPLLWPDLPGAGENVVKRYVLWPGGAVPHAGKWWLACGIDDTNCRMISLPFETVEAALNDVPEDDERMSIRNTPLALGVPAKR